MKDHTTAEIFEELWKRIEYDANVSEELASESNELQERIDKAIEYIDKRKKGINECLDIVLPKDVMRLILIELLDILKGSDKE